MSTAPSDEQGAGRAPAARGAAVVAVCMTAGNICAYGFIVLAAQALEPGPYGEVGALMGLLLVVGVVAIGLQANAARVAASHVLSPRDEVRRCLRRGLRSAAVLGSVGLLISPLVARALGFSSILTAVFAAAAAAFLAITGSGLGLLQGESRWYPFAAVQLLTGAGRLTIGGAVLLVWPTPVGAALGVAVAGLLPLTASLVVLLRRPAATTEAVRRPAPPARAVEAAEHPASVWHDSHVLLALLVLSNCDVMLARQVLPDHDTGLYAAGLIVTKAVLFLPQFVVAVAFPTMVRSRSASVVLRAGALVLGLGAAAVIGVLLLPSLATTVVGGSKYHEVSGQLWAFAVLGTLLSLINVLVFRLIAQGVHRAAWPLWAGALLIALASTMTGSLQQLLGAVVVVDVVVLAVLTALTFRDTSVDAGDGAAPTRAPARSS